MARSYIYVQKKPVRLPITHGVFPSVSNGGRNPSRDKAIRRAFLSRSSKPAGVAQLSGYPLVVPRHRACLKVAMSSSHTFRQVMLARTVDDRFEFGMTIGRSDEIKRSQLHRLQVLLHLASNREDTTNGTADPVACASRRTSRKPPSGRTSSQNTRCTSCWARATPTSSTLVTVVDSKPHCARICTSALRFPASELATKIPRQLNRRLTQIIGDEFHASREK